MPRISVDVDIEEFDDYDIVNEVVRRKLGDKVAQRMKQKGQLDNLLPVVKPKEKA